MKHRLLYLVGQLRSGGLERQLNYLLRAMDRELYKPALAVWNYCDHDLYVREIKAIGVPVYPMPIAGSSAGRLTAFCHLAKELNPEVIHSYSFYTNFAAYWAARHVRAIALGSIRSDFSWAKKESGPFLGRLSARFPGYQICNSQSAAEAVRCLRSPFAPRHLQVVRNGIDLRCFHNSLSDVSGPARIVGVGNLRPVKRWDRVLRVAWELKRNGLDFVIRIAGEGPLHDPLQHQARELGIEDRVQLIGHADNVPDLLADASFLVHTADSEGCPNAVIEAMASARAVVATDAGDIPSLVDDGKTGFVVPREDNAMLLTRLMKLISNRDLAKRMGESGRIKAESEFSLERLVADTLNAYRASGWGDT
jgi:glycosyltransferase involved in cell wall biosynthesis